MDPQFEYGLQRLTEASPCIDAGDPSNPYDPDNTRADQGALFFMAPPVTLEITPYGAPVFIPSSGGSFDFNLTLENVADSTVVVDVWLEVDVPTGGTVSPLILRTDMSLPIGTIIERTLTQSVPGSAPSGYYVYRAAAGEYPGMVYAMDSFNFAKLADDGGSGSVNNWNVSGWEIGSSVGETPTEFNLSPAYPNPFNPETNLTFSLPEDGHVSLVVYDINGREVATLYNGFYNAGIHHATFGADNLPSGVYVARLTSGSSAATQKIMLLK
jgi:hypothetical protein